MHTLARQFVVRTLISAIALIAFGTVQYSECPAQVVKSEIIIQVDAEQDNETQIRRLLKQQSESWNAYDIESFMETYWKSPQLTFSSGGATTRGWEATLQRYKDRYSTPELMGKLSFEILEVNMLGDESAFLLGTYRLEREQDQPHGNFTLVLRKMEGQWKIIHDHSSESKE